jgi:hypothetical protein
VKGRGLGLVSVKTPALHRAGVFLFVLVEARTSARSVFRVRSVDPLLTGELTGL